MADIQTLEIKGDTLIKHYHEIIILFSVSSSINMKILTTKSKGIQKLNTVQ